MILPLHNRLKKRMHVEIAALQDEVMEILYSIDPTLVLHGGTTIWRCYAGNRFSEDLDLYATDVGKIEEGLARRVKERGLELPKLKRTDNLVFGKVANGDVEVRIEINFAKTVKPTLGRYEKVDGTFMDIMTLSPEDLILEKLNAYTDRKFIRDIYDVYHLADRITETRELHEALRAGLTRMAPPIDEKNLQTIIYSGAVPTFDSIVTALKRRFK